MRKFTFLALWALATQALPAQKRFDYSMRVYQQGKQTNMEAFKGKPMLLELFSASCAVCFKKMPYMNELQKQFRDQLAVVLLGEDSKKLPATYVRFRDKFGLTMAAVFDSVAYASFNPPFAPYYIWVDAAGYIRGETGADSVTAENIRNFIKGNFRFLGDYSFLKRFDSKKLLERKLADLLVQSSLSRPVDSLSSTLPFVMEFTSFNKSFQAINADLSYLFLYSFYNRMVWDRYHPMYGLYWRWPVTDGDEELDSLLTQKFCYSVYSEEYRSPQWLRNRLQRDLEATFGLVGRLEERRMPYWSVQRQDTSTSFLRTKFLNTERSSSYSGFSFKRCSFQEILSMIEGKASLELPIIDETGIRWLIDFEIEADMTDWEEIRTQLTKKGFIIEKKFRPMQVIVVRRSLETVAAYSTLQR
jgi:thiol-disulfide isomerase/thioredoxin